MHGVQTQTTRFMCSTLFSAVLRRMSEHHEIQIDQIGGWSEKSYSKIAKDECRKSVGGQKLLSHKIQNGLLRIKIGSIIKIGEFAKHTFNGYSERGSSYEMNIKFN